MAQFSSTLKFPTPDFRSIWYRIDAMKDLEQKFSIPKDGRVDVAIASTGLRLANDGRLSKHKIWKKDKAYGTIELRVFHKKQH
ncbi:hypothetical protein M1141_01400 [Candidatus Marsarchaeota archaeon]|nr:hypothetical protein [Candidatus Marsarchaeota archaeon]